MAKTHLRLQFQKLGWIVLFWTVIGIGQFLFEYEVLVNHADIADDFPFWLYLFYDLVSIIIAALIGGFIMIFFLENWFRKRPYGQAMFLVFILYSITSIIISLPRVQFFV